MEDEWTTVISDGRLVKFTYSDRLNLAEVVFMTAQIAGHEVVYSILSNKGVEVPFSRADVERRFTFELRLISN
jgi:hypothetical protein